MNVGLEDISETYFDHLFYSQGKAKSALVIELCELELKKENGLLKLLDLTHDSGKDWIFSFWGKLFPMENGAVLNFVSNNEEDVTYIISEVSKNQKNLYAPSFEVSFACNLALLQSLFELNLSEFSHEFKFAGWQVPSSTKNLLLRNPKWAQGHFLFPSELNLAFCSGNDGDCIRFYASNENELKSLYEKVRTKLD